MKLLFVTYCFGSYAGQTLIGVYKRGLRVALELSDRGHEIFFFCTGRDAYHDELTEVAETRLHFIEIPFTVAAFEGARENRRTFLREIEQIGPDLVVIGEAPLAGAMLEAALCAVELAIPVVFLDNAYNPLFVDLFCETLGPMADGIILTGLSLQHASSSRAYLCQVPPFIESSPQAARALLTEKLGFRGERLITVLAYDSKVEQCGLSLLEALDLPDLEVLFFARDVEGCQQRLEQLPESKRERVQVITPPPDEIRFGLLELSRLAILKYGFMQVSECLALRTPAVAVYHEGPRWLSALPEPCKRFVWVATDVKADASTVQSAQRLFGMDPSEMALVHNGERYAASKAADFLEAMPRTQRRGTEVECSKLGFTHSRVSAALAVHSPDVALTLRLLRAMRLRVMPEYQLYAILCGHTNGGAMRYTRLWGRRYTTREAAKEDYKDARASGSARRVFFFSEADQLLIEEDMGEAELPPLNS